MRAQVLSFLLPISVIIGACDGDKPGGSGSDTGQSPGSDGPGSTDEGGEDSGSASGVFASVAISPAEGDRGTEFACTATLDDSAPAGTAVELEWLVDDAAWPDLANPIPPETLWRGAVLVCAATARDAGSLIGRQESAAVLVDNAAPQVALEAFGTPVEGELLVLHATANDLDGDPLVITLEDAPEDTSLIDHEDGTATITWPVPFGSEPDATIEVAADDGLQLGTATWSSAIAPGDHPPELLSDCEDEYLAIGEEFRCWLELEDADGDEITGLRLVSGPEGAWIDADSQELVWTPETGDGGRYELVLEIEAGGAVAEEPIDLVVPELTLLGRFAAEADETTEQTFTRGGPGLDSVMVQVPAGAFDEDVMIEVWSLEGAPSARIDAPVVQIGASEELQGAVVVELAYTDAYYEEGGLGDEEGYGLYLYDADMDEWQYIVDSSVDTETNTVRALVTELGTATGASATSSSSSGPWIAAMTEDEKGLTQSARFYVSDPARLDSLDCGNIYAWYSEKKGERKYTNAALRRMKEGFPWKPGSDNVLILHGWGGSPRMMAEYTFGHWARRGYPDAADPWHCDGGPAPQVVYFRYPSGQGIKRNAKRLKRKLNKFMRNHPDEFTTDVQFDVVGYSMGGVLGRTWLTLYHPDSPTDPARVIDSQIQTVVSVNSPHTGVDARSVLGAKIAHDHSDSTGFPDFELAMLDVWELYECTTIPRGSACPYGDPDEAREELRDRLDYWLYERVPEHSEGDLRSTREQLWTSWKQMAAGMAWFPIGSSSYDRTERLVCISGTMIDDDTLSSRALDVLSHHFDFAVIDLAADVADSDLIVPRRSQALEPYGASYGGTICAAVAQLSPVVHSNLAALELLDHRTDTLPSSITSDWCIDDQDVGAILDDWLGHGGPSCWGDASIASIFSTDSDADGYEVYIEDGLYTSSLPPDCDDWDPDTHPGAEETCDGRDNDCNGIFDDGLECHVDGDGDGFSIYGRDCDDSDPDIHPGAPEDVCDDIDDDCSGIPDDGLGCYDDADDDGWTIIDGDCDDHDASVHPDADEACNGEDDDCDGELGIDELDDDGDGWMECEGDCDETDDSIHPGALEACDDIDSDCDGDLYDGGEDLDDDGTPDCLDDDVDGDGDPGATDCDDRDASRYTGAAEACDDFDSDCDDSLVDEFDDLDDDGEPDCIDEDVDGDGDDADTDCDDTDPSRYHGAAEACDSIDSDCDGTLTDGYADWDGDGIPDCVDEDDDGDGDPDSTDCNDNNDAIYTGAPESCDSIDSDCDGSYVDGYDDTDDDGTPDCTDDDDDGDGDPDSSDCDPDNPYRYHGATEVPDDGIDQDCSGADRVTCWDDDDGDGYGDPDESLYDDDGDCDDSGQADNDEDCDDTKSWIAPGLEMYRLISVYSSDRKDHMITKLEPPGFTWGEEYADVTGSGLYDDADPKIIGYSVKTFPSHVGTPGSAWVKVRRSWSDVFEDHITHTSSTAPSDSAHGHGCSGSSCPDYELDSIDLGWIRDEDLGDYTRHWGRWWRADRLNHRMSQDVAHEAELEDRGFVDDGHSDWIFDEDLSCP